MSIKNNILNNFLSTATISALALGGLASVALAPIVVSADTTESSLEIKADDLEESDKYQVCMYDIESTDPDGGDNPVQFKNVGTGLNLTEKTVTGVNMDTKVNEAPSEDGEFQLSGQNQIAYWNNTATPEYTTVTLDGSNVALTASVAANAVDAAGEYNITGSTLTYFTTEPKTVTLATSGVTLTKLTTDLTNDPVSEDGEYNITGTTLTYFTTKATAEILTVGQYVMDEDGTTFVSDGANLFEIDLESGKNPTVADSNDMDDNAPFTEDSEFTLEDPQENALLVLLDFEEANDNMFEENDNSNCEYKKDNYNPLLKLFSNSSNTEINAILTDEDTFDDDEEDYQIIVNNTEGFKDQGTAPDLVYIKQVSGNESEKPGKIVNRDLNVSKGGTEEILKTDLEFQADGATESQVVYTITVTPKEGKLQRDLGNGNIEELGIGGQFSQQTINNGDLEYVHNGENDDADEFKFTVKNTEKDKVTSEKTMDIKIDETTADFKLCGSFESKVGQDEGDRVIMSKGVVEICDSEQDDNGDIKYTIESDAEIQDINPSVDGDERLGKGEYVVVYKDNITTNSEHDDGEEVSTFTLEEVEDGDIIVELLSTVPDNVSSETMSLKIEDGESDEDAEGVTLKFTFEDNTDPFVVNNTLNLGGVGKSATITEDDLKVDDGDDNYLDLKLEVTSSPSYGILKKDGASLGMGSTFEMEDIKDGKITYENTLDTSLDTVGFKATDPSGDSTGFTFRVNVTGGTTPSDCDFSDVPSSQTFNKEICGLKEKGVVNGYPDGSYGPNNNVTRGEMSKFVVKAFNMAEDTSCDNFPDAIANTFEKEISTLKCQGVVGGNNGKYLPNDSITRGEAMKIVVKAAESKGLTLDMTVSEGFADVPMDQTFYNEIYKAYSNGIAGGQDGNFYPERTITRGEMSKIVYNTHLMLVEKGLF